MIQFFSADILIIENDVWQPNVLCRQTDFLDSLVLLWVPHQPVVIPHLRKRAHVKATLRSETWHILHGMHVRDHEGRLWTRIRHACNRVPSVSTCLPQRPARLQDHVGLNGVWWHVICSWLTWVGQCSVLLTWWGGMHKKSRPTRRHKPDWANSWWSWSALARSETRNIDSSHGREDGSRVFDRRGKKGAAC